MSEYIQINKRRIGVDQKAYIIAELSANHNQDFGEASNILRAAKEAGADAIKLQTYTPDTMTINCARADFQIGKGTIWAGKNLYQLYGEAYTPWDWQPELMRMASDLGLDFFSTPFDRTAIDFLEKLDVPAYKIASFELVDTALLQQIARTGKTVIMSTGMATLPEIEEAVAVLREGGCTQLALLKCTSAYPAVPEEMNLRTIPAMAARFGVPVGLSDHTLGIAVPVAAVVLGACIIEKHLTLSRAKGGPDSTFSLEPAEFRQMVDTVRVAENALGYVNYELTEGEVASRVFRRSLYVVKDMKAGELFSSESVRSIRPSYGLSPKYLNKVLGCHAAVDIPRGTPLTWDVIK
jgi:pseudaminic acid synthase